MTQTYIHKDLGKILIYYSPKARSIRVQVGDNGIKLIIPLGVNIDKGLHFVNAKQDWIEKALKRTEQKKRHVSIHITELNSQTFSILTKACERTNILFRLHEKILTIEHPISLDITQAKYQQILLDGMEKFVVSEAKKHFSQRLAYLANKGGFTYNEFRIQRSKTRWGSCSSKKNINLCAYLLFVPAYLSDYVIIHELCHTKEMNHGNTFWNLVASQEPNYITYRKEIKQYGFLMQLSNRK